ncbi:hypothetical protein A8P50_11620 [Yersinia pestis]|nr:hypothetical protein A8P50_11620 [Yersinia pestis]
MVGLGLCFVSLGTVISLSAMVSLAKASVIHRPSVPAIEQEGRPPLLHLRLCSTSTPTTWVPFFISSALRAGFNLHPCRLTPFADVLSAHPTCVLQSALADSPFKVNGLKVKIKNQLQMQNQRAKIEPAVV